MNPFASLTVTYTISAIVSLILFFIVNKGGNPFHEVAKTNWAPFVLGIVIVGLEGGYIYAYKAGWSVNTVPVLQAAICAILLLFVSFFLYKEALSWKKIVGIVICLIGLVFLNLK